MRVRLTRNYAGPRGCASPGAVLDLPPAEAYALIEAGAAVQDGAPAFAEASAGKPELALSPPSATAVAPRGRLRGAPDGARALRAGRGSRRGGQPENPEPGEAA